MPSPFPGMNPFLERRSRWEDFHNEFILELRRALVPLVPPTYRVASATMVFLGRHDERPTRVIKPDAHVTLNARHAVGGTVITTMASPAPARFSLIEPEAAEEHIYLEIRDDEDREVVTAIELLSRANKRPGDDRVRYLAKRRALRRAGAHFIEIDLLRTRPRLLPGRVSNTLPAFDFYAAVMRDEEQPEVALWPFSLRDRLPLIPIPLRAPDPDVVIDLQAVLNTCYDAAGYASWIYDRPPEPRLNAEGAVWAAELLAAADVAGRGVDALVAAK